jgi:hypothetical protein
MPLRLDAERSHMEDIVFIAVVLAFFAVCVAYVRGLDRIVRVTEEAEAAQEVVDDIDYEAAA